MTIADHLAPLEVGTFSAVPFPSFCDLTPKDAVCKRWGEGTLAPKQSSIAKQ